ncbi:hypothetical protein BH23CHL10_BH23CHL10_06660 [soil metagenome]
MRVRRLAGAAAERQAQIVRILHEREPLPSMVMVDGQTVRGARYGPTFHEAGGRGGRTIGTRRSLLVEILGLPLAAHATSARPHDVWPRASCSASASVTCRARRPSSADRAYRARLAERKRVGLDIKAPPAGRSGFTPIRPLYKIEHAFAPLGRWRCLSRCYEGSEASATAWLERIRAADLAAMDLGEAK